MKNRPHPTASCSVDREENLLTVERANGQHVTYDPERLHGVGVYREAEREFSAGDRVQFTAPYRDEHIANRQLGTPIWETPDRLRREIFRSAWTLGRDVQLNIREHPHLDYGYAVTSHSSQGVTADRVLVHVDIEQESCGTLHIGQNPMAKESPLESIGSVLNYATIHCAECPGCDYNVSMEACFP